MSRLVKVRTGCTGRSPEFTRRREPVTAYSSRMTGASSLAEVWESFPGRALFVTGAALETFGSATRLTAKAPVFSSCTTTSAVPASIRLNAASGVNSPFTAAVCTPRTVSAGNMISLPACCAACLSVSTAEPAGMSKLLAASSAARTEKWQARVRAQVANNRRTRDRSRGTGR